MGMSEGSYTPRFSCQLMNRWSLAIHRTEGSGTMGTMIGLHAYLRVLALLQC